MLIKTILNYAAQFGHLTQDAIQNCAARVSNYSVQSK